MKRSLAVALVATLAFLGTACGDDDDTSTATDDETSEDSTTTAPEDEGSGDGEGEEAAGDGDFCTTFQELLAGEPTPEQVRSLGEIAPDSATGPLDTIATKMEDDPEGYFEDPEFAQAFSELGSASVEECADEALDVTAVEYEFQGFPEEVAAGVLGVNLSNDGKEVHELVIVRKNDDTTESFEEIFAMDDDAALELVTEAGFSFANPGEGTGGLYDVSEPGEYAAVCFIPTGTTSFEAEGEGPPHAAQGMLATFTVG